MTAKLYRVTNDRYTSDTDCTGTLADLQSMCDAAGWDQPTTLTERLGDIVDEAGEIVAIDSTANDFCPRPPRLLPCRA